MLPPNKKNMVTKSNAKNVGCIIGPMNGKNVHKISVLTWYYSRQEMLDKTLPLWLKQDYPNYEIIVGHGPIVDLPHDSKIVPVFTPGLEMCKAYNKMLKEATGDILLITQCDMQVTSPSQLSRMYEVWAPGRIVTEKFFKNGKRDAGIFLQFMMVEKKKVEEAGGWCELYDNPESAAHEDSDLVSSLLENGLSLFHTQTPEEEGVFHIEHPRPDYLSPALRPRLQKGREIYDSRHKNTIFQLYAKQFARHLMDGGKKI